METGSPMTACTAKLAQVSAKNGILWIWYNGPTHGDLLAHTKCLTAAGPLPRRCTGFCEVSYSMSPLEAGTF